MYGFCCLLLILALFWLYLIVLTAAALIFDAYATDENINITNTMINLFITILLHILIFVSNICTNLNFKVGLDNRLVYLKER